MKKTQEKILKNAIKLFNKNGVGNVRLQDIAKKSGVSAGNLSYHYKLKKDLIKSVLDYMSQSSKELSSCLLYTSPSPRDQRGSRMPSSA